jgi:NADPH:quinone reductase-like Zn-dependent oxidoreductase
MKSIRIHSYGDSGEMQVEEADRPKIGEGEILVKVMAAGVNPVDWKIREGYLKQFLPKTFPLTLGQDLAGVVAEVGKNVSQFKTGDEVFGFGAGAYAEYVAARDSEIALKPKTVDFVIAASIPTAGLTAWQALIDVAHVSSGQTVLIHGAAGGVGSFAVQIAKWKDARVVATASADDAVYLKSLGVEQVIDYRKERFEDRPVKADIVFDLIGGETLDRSYTVVKKGGIIVTTVGQPDKAKARAADIRVTTMMVKRDGSELAQLSQLVDRGIVKPRVDQVLPLKEARQAQDLNQSGKTHGKIVLQVA